MSLNYNRYAEYRCAYALPLVYIIIDSNKRTFVPVGNARRAIHSLIEMYIGWAYACMKISSRLA